MLFRFPKNTCAGWLAHFQSEWPISRRSILATNLSRMKISNAPLQGSGSLQGANRGAQLQDWGLQGGQVCLVSSCRIVQLVCKIALVPFYPSASLGLFQEWERLLLTILITIRGGKDCWTEFERLSFNGSTSVVLCRPHTGRMHQIRVHLQFLGEDRSLYFIFLFNCNI